MPIIHVNADDGLPTTFPPDATHDDGGPVVIMVHGFKYAPGHATECPHRHIFALAPERACFKVVGWPRGRAARPEHAAPRWSRLIPDLRPALPIGRKASS